MRPTLEQVCGKQTPSAKILTLPVSLPYILNIQM